MKQAGYVESAARARATAAGRCSAGTSSRTPCGRSSRSRTLGVGQSIVWASSLAFLGLGVAAARPEWGALLDAGRALHHRRPGGSRSCPASSIVAVRPGGHLARPHPAAPTGRSGAMTVVDIDAGVRRRQLAAGRPSAAAAACENLAGRLRRAPRSSSGDLVHRPAGQLPGHRRRVRLGQERHRPHPGRADRRRRPGRAPTGSSSTAPTCCTLGERALARGCAARDRLRPAGRARLARPAAPGRRRDRRAAASCTAGATGAAGAERGDRAARRRSACPSRRCARGSGRTSSPAACASAR